MEPVGVLDRAGLEGVQRDADRREEQHVHAVPADDLIRLPAGELVLAGERLTTITSKGSRQRVLTPQGDSAAIWSAMNENHALVWFWFLPHG